MAIQVPAKVFEGLEKVRQSGKCNMLMTQQVQYWAFHMGEYETVNWLNDRDNCRRLSRGVFEGVESEDVESEDGDTEEIIENVSEMIEDGDIDFLEEGD